MKETATRSVTGLLFASVVIAAVVWSLWSNLVFWGVVSLVAVAEWRRPMVLKNQFSSLLFAMLMVGMTAVMLFLVWDWKSGFNPAPLLTFIGMIWANDTGAYLVGKPLGKHKLMPRVSPGKSWEGLIGGVTLAGLAAWWLMGWEWAWIGVILGMAATAGDLVESAWKRGHGIKDSGSILPGHGGVLDRFDGFLFAAPIFFLVVYCFDIQFFFYPFVI